MKLLMGVFAALTIFASSQAFAAGIELAQKNGCMACHKVDGKLVGPGFKEVAAKYKGKKANDTLAAKVSKGGSGVWGTIPMPPNPKISPEDIKALVSWVLAQ